MPHELRTELPPDDADDISRHVIGLGGGFDFYPAPQALLQGARELARHIVGYLKIFLNLPAGAQGGLLQPPVGSHFGREVQSG